MPTSLRMTPNSATNKLESAPLGKGIKVAVNSGSAVTASVWVRKDATYTGSQPRLIVRANAAIGINSDTVLATASDVTSGTAVTWDSATVTAVTLSGGDLIATNTGTSSVDQGARVAAASGKTTGKYYFEVTLTAYTGGSSTSFGIGTTTSTYTNMGGSSTVGAMLMRTGAIKTNGGFGLGYSMGTIATGTVIGIAVDLDNRKIWFCRTSNGFWNSASDAGRNPATNVGGEDIPAGTMIPFVPFGGTGGATNNIITANFGATAFSGVVPAGFISGWGVQPGSPGTATWVQLSGTTPSATDDGAVELIVDCDGGGFINVDDWAAS